MSRVSPRHADPQVPTALVEAAAQLLAEQGPAALSARRLATAVGSSTTAVYTHFGSMNDLVRAMAREGFARLHQRMTAVSMTDDPVADVVTLGCAYRSNARDNPHLYAVMFGGSSLAGFSLTDEDRQHGRYTLEILVGAVTRCMTAGRFQPADPQLVAHQMWIAVHGLVTLDLGRYLVDPYHADACYQAQVSGLMLGAGDDAAATAQSVRRALDRYTAAHPDHGNAAAATLAPGRVLAGPEFG